jgi:hypothetical protein
MNEARAARRLIPASKWHQHHPWPTQAALRDLILKAGRNGLASAIRRVGRRVLIDEAAFFAWVESQNGGGRG